MRPQKSKQPDKKKKNTQARFNFNQEFTNLEKLYESLFNKSAQLPEEQEMPDLMQDAEILLAGINKFTNVLSGSLNMASTNPKIFKDYQSNIGKLIIKFRILVLGIEVQNKRDITTDRLDTLFEYFRLLGKYDYKKDNRLQQEILYAYHIVIGLYKNQKIPFDQMIFITNSMLQSLDLFPDDIQMETLPKLLIHSLPSLNKIAIPNDKKQILECENLISNKLIKLHDKRTRPLLGIRSNQIIVTIVDRHYELMHCLYIVTQNTFIYNEAHAIDFSEQMKKWKQWKVNYLDPLRKVLFDFNWSGSNARELASFCKKLEDWHQLLHDFVNLFTRPLDIYANEISDIYYYIKAIDKGMKAAISIDKNLISQSYWDNAHNCLNTQKKHEDAINSLAKKSRENNAIADAFANIFGNAMQAQLQEALVEPVNEDNVEWDLTPSFLEEENSVLEELDTEKKMHDLLNSGYMNFRLGNMDEALFDYYQCLDYAEKKENTTFKKIAWDCIASLSTNTLIHNLARIQRLIDMQVGKSYIDLDALTEALETINSQQYFKIIYEAYFCYKEMEEQTLHWDINVSTSRRHIEKTISRVRDLINKLEVDYQRVLDFFEIAQQKHRMRNQEKKYGVGLLKGEHSLDDLKKMDRSQYIIYRGCIAFFSKWDKTATEPVILYRGEPEIMDRLFPEPMRLLSEKEDQIIEITGYYRTGARKHSFAPENTQDTHKAIEEKTKINFTEKKENLKKKFTTLFRNYNHSKTHAQPNQFHQKRIVKIPDCLHSIFSTLELSGEEVYLYGGTVRRILRKDPNFLQHDLDFVLFEPNVDMRTLGFKLSPHINDLWVGNEAIDGQNMPVNVRIVRRTNMNEYWLKSDMKKHDFTNAFYCSKEGYITPVSELSFMHLENHILAANGDPVQILAKDPVSNVRAINFILDREKCDETLEEAMKNWLPPKNYQMHVNHVCAKLQSLMHEREVKKNQAKKQSKEISGEEAFVALMFKFGLLEKLLGIAYQDDLAKSTIVVKKRIIEQLAEPRIIEKSVSENGQQVRILAKPSLSDPIERPVKSVQIDKEPKTSEHGLFAQKNMAIEQTLQKADSASLQNISKLERRRSTDLSISNKHQEKRERSKSISGISCKQT